MRTNGICITNPAVVLENDTHKLTWDFDIQTDHLISARRPDLIVINNKKKKKKEKKKNLQNYRFYCPDWPRNKTKKSEKKNKYLDLARELKKNYGIWR